MQTYFKQPRKKKKRIKWSPGKWTWCETCGEWAYCHPHHVFNGRGLRKISEEYGAIEYHCDKHHDIITDNAEIRKAIKKKWQIRLMAEHGWTEEFWIQKWGKSYLDAE